MMNFHGKNEEESAVNAHCLAHSLDSRLQTNVLHRLKKF